MKNEVIRICGAYPENFKSLEITSDPNFVFENDPSFNPVKVWDSENNYVFVNSFQECEHYVLGGWNFDTIYTNELGLQNSLLTITVIGFLLYRFVTRKINI